MGADSGKLTSDYINRFRTWYILWVDDLLYNEVGYIFDTICKKHSVYRLVFARSLYDALVLGGRAQTDNDFPDFLVLDVDLSRGNERLADPDPRRANPFATKTNLYRGDGKILEASALEDAISRLRGAGCNKNWPSGAEMAGDLAQGGLYAWAVLRNVASAKFTDRNVVIYTGFNKVKKDYRLVEYGGLLTIMGKGEFFRRDSDAKFGRYVTTADLYNEFYNEFYDESKSRLQDGATCHAITTEARDLNNEILPSQLWTGRARSGTEYLAESFDRHGSDARLVVRVFEPSELKGSDQDEELPLVSMLKELIHVKISSAEGLDAGLDPYVIRTLLSERGLWTIRIGNSGTWERVPFGLAPLRGRVDVEKRTITIEDEGDPACTFLLASLFLPWSDKLTAEDPTTSKSAALSVTEHYGHLLGNGVSAMGRFWKPDPYHSFIEQSAPQKTKEDAHGFYALYTKMQMDRFLSPSTAAFVKSYLNPDQQRWKAADEWKRLKRRVELEIKGIRQFFELNANESTYTLHRNFEDNTTRGYADFAWIESVIETALNNLTPEKAFRDRDRPRVVTVDVRFTTVDAHRMLQVLRISVADNGVGFDVRDERNFTRGPYRRFFREGAERRLLRAYGELTIESRGWRRRIGAGEVTPIPDGTSSDIGTLVVLDIYWDLNS